MDNKVIIFSAPSGSGKTTIVRHLLGCFPSLCFSVSATSRSPRGSEVDGVDYHFLSGEEFSRRVQGGEFIEWEEVYSGTCYGTLRSEVEAIWSRGGVVVFDVDVVGGLRLKEIMGDKALSMFIMPPSVESLRSRLEGRGTDSAEAIERRVGKATEELAYSSRFDKVVVNDILEEALAESEDIVSAFLAC
ncbi:MAG: guanylate kinase [Rikenellaceae bacterium]